MNTALGNKDTVQTHASRLRVRCPQQRRGRGNTFCSQRRIRIRLGFHFRVGIRGERVNQVVETGHAVLLSTRRAARSVAGAEVCNKLWQHRVQVLHLSLRQIVRRGFQKIQGSAAQARQISMTRTAPNALERPERFQQMQELPRRLIQTRSDVIQRIQRRHGQSALIAIVLHQIGRRLAQLRVRLCVPDCVIDCQTVWVTGCAHAFHQTRSWQITAQPGQC